jgi:pectinesterase
MTALSRRTFCAGIAAAGLTARAGATLIPIDATVRRGGGSHTSLAAALAAAPPGDRPYRVLVGRGRWEEKLVISRPNVILIGEDRRGSVITSSVAAGHPKPGGSGNWGTYGSSTLTAEAPGFEARNLTIENDFDYMANLINRAVEGSQAVALALGNSADRSIIHSVDLIGHQDTFYLRAGRALVRDCFITGNVDFIFGGAAARFEQCEIRSRLRPNEELQGYVAAPSTHRDQPHGLVFDRCRLTREAGIADASVWLGRPWRAGGNTELLGMTAYLNCWMDSHIHPDGWTWMGYRGPGGYPMRLEPGDARFFEYASRGPGDRRSPHRRQLGAAEARRLSRAAMFGDWHPA